MHFYIDESGNTGGITQKSYASSFDGQRIFSLVALGLISDEDLAEKIQPLIDKYRVKSTEFKASTFYKKRPAFLRELFALIKKEQWPIFIEIVDKKFMLSANIVNSLVLPAHSFLSETPQTNYVRNIFAEYIFYHATEHLFDRFLTICAEPSRTELMAVIDEFIAQFASRETDVSFALVHSLLMTKEDLQKPELANEDVANFLPGTDISKRGKALLMLPNLSSFINIYARLNLFMKGDLSSMQIFHDEQLQFDEIIEKAKCDVENFPHSEYGYISSNSDYHFRETAKLLFKASHDSLGIQIADAVAGFSRRYFDDVQNERSIHPELKEAQRILMSMNNQRIGVGLNMVTSAHDADKINRNQFE
jgi:hypothetical protein